MTPPERRQARRANFFFESACGEEDAATVLKFLINIRTDAKRQCRSKKVKAIRAVARGCICCFSLACAARIFLYAGRRAEKSRIASSRRLMFP